MLEEFKERIENAKKKQYRLLERFHVGDAVYPFWLRNFLVYGIVIEIDMVARKVICDFNGVRRQFCPEDLMLVNPDLANRDTLGIREAMKTASVETHLSPDTDNGIDAICDDCGGEIAVSYDEKTARTDFVCTNCGKRIPENMLSKESKKAMRKAAMRADQPLYDVKDQVGELDKKTYTHYVVLDKDGTIESGHASLKKAEARMEKLRNEGFPCHIVERDGLKLRPTDDTHWFRGILASDKRLAKEIAKIAIDIAKM